MFLATEKMQTLSEKLKKLRTDSFGINVISFWILGLCNNFAYVVMLSAAHDILESSTAHSIKYQPPQIKLQLSNSTVINKRSSLYECNTISTGAILLADILPTLVLKLLAPFFLIAISYNIRISFVIMFGFLSLLIVSVAYSTWENILGVVFASLSTGLGDYSFLSLSSYYHKNILSAWASGTGAAGLFGSLSYAGLISLGLSSQNTLMIMLFMPVLMGFAFFWLLNKPGYVTADDSQLENDQQPSSTKGKFSTSSLDLVKDQEDVNIKAENSAEAPNLYPPLPPKSKTTFDDNKILQPSNSNIPSSRSGTNTNSSKSNFGDINTTKKSPLLPKKDERLSYYNSRRTFDFTGRIVMIFRLLPYMLPLGIVYFSEYFINQGLFELTYFRGIWLDHSSQYRWYLVDYQLGVFISRSSFKVLPMPYLWIFPCLQLINVCIFLANVHYFFIPTIWIVFVLIFFEGFIGGAAYVNTFHKIAYDHEDCSEREFCLGAASLADTTGISLAGFTSLPVHNYFCSK